MTSKLIALVDASVYARSVVEHAAWAARRTGWPVELMHVLGRREGATPADLSGAIALGARTRLLNELTEHDAARARLAREHGRALLEDARALLAAEGIAAVEHLRFGDLVEAVAEREAEAAMFVMGKRGAAADFARGHLGSNLERVVRSVTRPLLVANRAFRPIRRVLVATDGSANALRAVDLVATSPIYADLELCVVTVGPEGARSRAALDAAAARLDAAGRPARTVRIDGAPEDALGRFIEAEGFDHLVIGATGHSRLKTLFVGSTTLEMLRSCKVPILLVR